jgi:hypothetical protein
MIRHHWTLIARKTHIDQESHNMIVGEVVEDMQISFPTEMEGNITDTITKQGYIFVPVQLEIVSGLMNDEVNAKSKISFEIELPNGNKLDIGNVETGFGKNGLSHTRLLLQALPISGSGTNTFRLFTNVSGKAQLLAELPLLIRVFFKKIQQPITPQQN